MGVRKWMAKRGVSCLCIGEQLDTDEMVPSSDSLATRDYSANGYSSRTGESERRPDNGNIEEAESSLREGSCLNYEEARALLGRLEYQRGNIEAALHVFEGIDIGSVTSKMKLCLTRRVDRRKRHSQNDVAPLMSVHTVSLLFEAIYLKAKSLEVLRRYREAAQSCKVILDTIESASPDCLLRNFGTDSKLQEILNKSVELLPELWKLSQSPQEAILSYRRALLHHWSLDTDIETRIQKEFAIFLLYSGSDATPPNLRSQVEGSFVPKNNIEEAILLLMIMLRKSVQKRIKFDASVVDHLSYALSVVGELRGLAGQIEEILPEDLDRDERYYSLALCYYGEGEDLVAFNLLKNMFSSSGNPNSVQSLLLASKVCGENSERAEEGVGYARKALSNFQGGCSDISGVANFLLGVSLSSHARSAVSDSEKIIRQSQALEALEIAERAMRETDPKVIFHLTLENADLRKLDVALCYAKVFLRLQVESDVKGWVLLARILSAQKEFKDAEIVINNALKETGKWDQGELLRTKAKLQIAEGELKNAIETYTQLLGILHVQKKSSRVGGSNLKGNSNKNKSLELETWHDMANIYTSLSRWQDAELCLTKSKEIAQYSASRWHTRGLMCQAKGLHKEALEAFTSALDIEHTYVPSLISEAVVLMHLGGSQSFPVARSLLQEALRLDRMNHSAWYNLALLYKQKGDASAQVEAAECFQAACLLEESAPLEPFR
ncbi:hypothetical protein GIB67_030218 [Kingdonia uniflora]|uniref:Uncharacterized protein n=1 Tax=Kingdonia uniflora TaxID=39325 RepID=A0A7J7MMM9_9MAGN|nr:hypothetical protein GIB67_030218 [Kingdonia uniflora]